jgi:hypothetical protein
VRSLAKGAVASLVLATALSGCTGAPRTSPPSTSAPPKAEAATGPCSETHPRGFVHIRPDGTKPFGAFFTHGLRPTDNENGDEPDCARSLRVQVDRLGGFRPNRWTRVAGHHRVYRLYRVTVRNGLPGTVWPIDEFQVVAIDGSHPADRVADTHRRVGIPPTDRLPVGGAVTWLEAFSDDEGDQAVIVTPSRSGLDGGLQTADIFTER